MKRKVIVIVVIMLLILGTVYFAYSKGFFNKQNKENDNVAIYESTILYDKLNNEIAKVEMDNTQIYNEEYSDYIQSTIDVIIDNIMQKENIDREKAKRFLVDNKLQIYTNLDPNVQKSLINIYSQEKYFNLDKVMSVTTITDYKSGEVVAIKGRKDNSNVSKNMAVSGYNAYSALNVISVYAPALDKGIIDANSILKDEPVKYELYSPTNPDKIYRGDVNIKDAIKLSLNTVPLKILEKVGVDTSYDFLEKLEFKNIEDIHKDIPGLGIAIASVNSVEMASAYGTIANSGVYMGSRLFNKVVNQNGIYINNNASETRVFSEKTCNDLKEILKLENSNNCLKVGLSPESNNNWACGFNSSYAISTWYGYSFPKKTVPKSNIENLSLEILNTCK